MEAKNHYACCFAWVLTRTFDAEPAEAKAVWAAFGEMWNGIHDLPGVHVFGNLDDDQSMVGASTGWPWTTYLLADVRILRQYMLLVTYLERPWWVKGHTNFGNIAKLKLVLGVN